MTQTTGIPIVVSGPSGVGKGTVVSKILERHPQLVCSVSMTTRISRPGEQEGVDYFFVSHDKFERTIAQGELVEWAQVYSNYYGTPKAFLEKQFKEGRDVILVIDVQGAAAVRSFYKNGIFIYLIPPSLEELKRRLLFRNKGQSDNLEQRMNQIEHELRFAGMYEYVVINDNVVLAAEELYAIIAANRLRYNRMIPRICETGLFPEKKS